MSSSVIQYIEVSSAHRNRNLYTSPADFDIEVSQTGVKGYLTALDPVSTDAPVKIWNNSFRNDSDNNTVVITGATVGVGGNTDNKVLIITAAVNQLRRELNYYDGAVLAIDVAGTTCYRRLVWYEYLTSITAASDRAVVWIDNTLPNGAIGAGTLTNPTMLTSSGSNVSGYPQIFIPQGEDIENYYVNYYIRLVGESFANSLLITAYDAVTHMATLSGPTGALVEYQTAGQDFTISKTVPSYISTFAAATVSSNAFYLGTGASAEADYYVNSWIHVTSPAPTTPYSTYVAPYDESRKIVRYVTLYTTVASVGASTVVLSDGSTEDNFYVGCFLINSSVPNTMVVTAYVGSTKTATVDVLGLTVAGNIITIKTAFIESPFTANPTTNAFEILQFTTDISSPFNYFGSTVSQQEGVNYEIELLNLILPNIVLDTSRGGRIVFYPYVYVAFHNSRSQYTSRNSIYSNNPSATRNLFRAIVSDTSSPLITPFIRIRGDGMKQTVKFKPNDNVHFSVHLPDGSVFNTTDDELYGPNYPNPLIQISAIFAVRRV